MEVPSHATVGAAIELLSSKGASLAVVVDSDRWEVQADPPPGIPPVGCCLGLVHLSWLVLWSLEQADRAERDDESASQPDSPVTPATELPADAVTPDGVDLPLLLAWRWTGEGACKSAQTYLKSYLDKVWIVRDMFNWQWGGKLRCWASRLLVSCYMVVSDPLSPTYSSLPPVFWLRLCSIRRNLPQC